MNQFLSTFTSKVFLPVCVGYYTDKRMHYQVFVICVAIFMCESNQEPRFFAECTGITSTSPTLILLTDTFDHQKLSFIIVQHQLITNHP